MNTKHFDIIIHGNDTFMYEFEVHVDSFKEAYEHALKSIEQLQKTTIEALDIHSIIKFNISP